MSDNWTSGLKNMKQALNNAHAIAVCGLGGISLENQHAAFRLMRMLGAYGYVERTLLPTLTRGSKGFAQCRQGTLSHSPLQKGYSQGHIAARKTLPDVPCGQMLRALFG